MRCEGAVLPSGGQAKRAEDATDMHAHATVYVGGNMHRDFSVSALLTLPRVSANVGLFDTDWLLLTRRGLPGEDPDIYRPFVQIELMRWKKFDYNAEIAFTWTDDERNLVYVDSTLPIDDTIPHRFAIAAHDDALTMSVDGRVVCRAQTSHFFGPQDRLDVQVGDELVHSGDRLAGTIADLRRKTDDDAAEKPYAGACRYESNGVRWVPDGIGSFHAEGVASLGEAGHFVGFDRNALCPGD
jgi:hypothetical protein